MTESGAVVAALAAEADGILVHKIPQATVLRQALDVIALALEDCDSGRAPARTESPLSVKKHSTRSQLRYIDAGTTPSSELERAARDASQILSAALGPRAESEVEVLDAFFYAPSSEVPCPAHTDPGLVTLVVDNSSGLEVQGLDGEWRRLALGHDEVAILAGRQL